MSKFPEGAIKSRAEIETLMAKITASKHLPIYAVWGETNIGNLPRRLPQKQAPSS